MGKMDSPSSMLIKNNTDVANRQRHCTGLENDL